MPNLSSKVARSAKVKMQKAVKAIGIKMTLLTKDPLVTAQTMGNSRSEDTFLFA